MTRLPYLMALILGGLLLVLSPSGETRQEHESAPVGNGAPASQIPLADVQAILLTLAQLGGVEIESPKPLS